MKQSFPLENLDCALCAEKMEAAIRKIDGVEDVNVSFILQKLTLTADNAQFESIMKQVTKACKKIEPDCKILIQ